MFDQQVCHYFIYRLCFKQLVTTVVKYFKCYLSKAMINNNGNIVRIRNKLERCGVPLVQVSFCNGSVTRIILIADFTAVCRLGFSNMIHRLWFAWLDNYEGNSHINWVCRVNTDLLKHKKSIKISVQKRFCQTWFASWDSRVMICPLSELGEGSLQILFFVDVSISANIFKHKWPKY